MPINHLLLHVEDDSDDAMLIGRALVAAGLEADIRVVENGSLARDYLLGNPPFEGRLQNPLPDLILLDLNMPVMNGHDFLKWRAERRDLKRIPVVVLTSSSSEADIASAYEAGANSYLTKPIDHSQLQEMLAEFRRFWFNWNRLAS